MLGRSLVETIPWADAQVSDALEGTKINQERDLKETKKLKAKRVAPLTNIKMIDLPKDLTSPAKAMMTKGVKIKVKDLSDLVERPASPVKMTNYEVGVHEDKNIIVPSFGTTSALFTRHF